MIRKFALLLGVLLSNATFAVEQAAPPKIDRIYSMPMQEMKVIESNGQLLFMSPNARFVFKGTMHDVWQQTELSTIEQVDHALKTINVDRLGFKVDDLNTISIGEGPKRVIVFVDPLCKACDGLLKTLESKRSQYTFKIIVVPALGDESQRLSRNLFCAKDKSKAFDYLLSKRIGELEQREGCDTGNYDVTLTVATLFNIRAVPFWIAPDGRFTSRGDPAVWSWIENVN